MDGLYGIIEGKRLKKERLGVQLEREREKERESGKGLKAKVRR